MRVYIGNPANRDTRTIGYQPAGEVDDMVIGVLERPLSSPTQFVSFAKKVQTIISSHRVVIPESPYRSVVLVELRWALIDCSVAGHVEDALLPLLIWADEDMQTSDVEERQSHPGGLGTSYTPPRTSSSGYSGSFQAPPPLSTTGSSTTYMPLSYAFSSDSNEHDNEQTDDVMMSRRMM
ncbi:hypothetical protein M9H77_11910 [Catharanthus roseus]|uniref:Uncharacterized protein n=1 Tax=Catharanthus roseus TaxID=4058 RepID=A0ACC0BG04_CATRO|nr:hypothetical protein M9H77_11910 [Catharanthus roseus]